MSEATWQRLGPIVRTQIHTDRMVDDGEYHVDKLIEVDEILLSSHGLIGHVGGVAILHGHHRLHPNKTREHDPRRFLPKRLLSIGFTSHYAAMADHFGAAPIGCAGEDIIVECGGRVSADHLDNGLQIRRDGTVIAELAGVVPAQPCIPFTTFMLGSECEPDQVTASRAFLRDGMRGFVAGMPSLDTDASVATGDDVWARA